MGKLTSIQVFLLCLALGVIISAIKVDFYRLSPFEILDNLFFSFMYNFLIALPSSMLAMFMWEYYKKKEINEIAIYQYRGLFNRIG